MELIIVLLLAAVFASAITNKVFGSGQIEYVLIEPVPLRRRMKHTGLAALAIVGLAVWGPVGFVALPGAAVAVNAVWGWVTHV